MEEDPNYFEAPEPSALLGIMAKDPAFYVALDPAVFMTEMQKICAASGYDGYNFVKLLSIYNEVKDLPAWEFEAICMGMISLAKAEGRQPTLEDFRKRAEQRRVIYRGRLRLKLVSG